MRVADGEPDYGGLMKLKNKDKKIEKVKARTQNNQTQMRKQQSVNRRVFKQKVHKLIMWRRA